MVKQKAGNKTICMAYLITWWSVLSHHDVRQWLPQQSNNMDMCPTARNAIEDTSVWGQTCCVSSWPLVALYLMVSAVSRSQNLGHKQRMTHRHGLILGTQTHDDAPHRTMMGFHKQAPYKKRHSFCEYQTYQEITVTEKLLIFKKIKFQDQKRFELFAFFLEKLFKDIIWRCHVSCCQLSYWWWPWLSWRKVTLTMNVNCGENIKRPCGTAFLHNIEDL